MEENPNKSANYALLEERLKRLDQKHFDWQAWKKGTLLVLEKIFGPDSLYVKELANTDYQYNSWSLRDTAGSEDPVKESVRELLRICITDAASQEPKKAATPGKNTAEVKEILKQFFDGATLSEIEKIASSDTPSMTKEEQIQKIISDKIPKYQTALLGKILLWVAG
ncbi:MAG: hypothetical protein PWQ17_1512 [Anaerophaga sp.]|uniref:hypothetical protein n=1 Tax=Anaerophaga thermohalophila TaxID=177400 RepID=UPI000237BD03|nr:hypothetical protein [Anaerophaga thermohalophila]MDK2842007.1 hypothetical protein [Anaerophaga sp.]MDN5292214.1 hypothetical protein [Anaerophaga sp.]